MGMSGGPAWPGQLFGDCDLSGSVVVSIHLLGPGAAPAPLLVIGKIGVSSLSPCEVAFLSDCGWEGLVGKVLLLVA